MPNNTTESTSSQATKLAKISGHYYVGSQGGGVKDYVFVKAG